MSGIEVLPDADTPEQVPHQHSCLDAPQLNHERCDAIVEHCAEQAAGECGSVLERMHKKLAQHFEGMSVDCIEKQESQLRLDSLESAESLTETAESFD